MMSALVTLACAVIAFPDRLLRGALRRGWTKALFYLAVMMPLWSSYLVKVYAWKLILAKEGIITWLAKGLHLSWLLDGILALPVVGGPSLSFSYIGTFLVFVYIWIPYMILPIQAALERVPVNYIEASADLGAQPRQTFWTVIFPLALPGIIAGSIFTFSLTLGDYIVPTIVGNSRLMIGQAVYTLQGTAGNIPLAAAFTVVPMVIMGILSVGGEAHGGVRCPLSQTATTPLGLRIAAIAGLLFLHLPLALIVLYAFTTEEKSFQFPPPGYTTKWFGVAWSQRPDIWPPLYLSLEVAAIATVLALIFGTLAAAALSRAKFFGRETISLLFVLPIALPGIITGISLRSAFDIMGIDFSIWTIVLGHATFCIVVVYNNAIARFRRLSGNLIEASMDLGANGFQTFRHVILPQIGTALLAGGMLAFALSFDEVIVTTFTAGQQTTLPIWMLSELIRPRQRPVTNVVAVFVIAVTLVADPRRLLSDARGRAHSADRSK